MAITTATTGATIRYTRDGSEPSWTSPVYRGPLTVDASSTLEAKAFKEDWTPSGSASETYTVSLANTVLPPDFDVAAGVYPTSRTVTLTTGTPGALIHYTTDGSEPTESDPSVSSGGTVSVDQSLTLKAKAFASGLTPSPTRRADYQITGAVSGAYLHGLALKTDGTVVSWGANNWGQIGRGTPTAS